MKLKLSIILLLCCGFMSLKAQTTVSGAVTDDTNQTLPGVNILVKGTNRGINSDFDGNYSIEVSKGETLQFSYMGFVTQEILITNQSLLNVSLKSDSQNLDEIVLIGYGGVKKSNLTGAVSTVKGEELTERPVSNIADALQGKVAGVLVRPDSYAPGAGINIQIRGVNSFSGSSNPLFVVDGIPMEQIHTISPNDIESMEILKDAASSAIYGSRGSNGVVIITTKRGKLGQPLISYNTNLTMQSVDSDKIGLMNGEQFALTINESQIARGTDPANVWYDGSSLLRQTPAEAAINGTDWMDLALRAGNVQNHYLNISGATDKNKYSMSLSSHDNKGVVIGHDYNRYTFNVSNNHEVTPWLTAGFNLSLSREKNDYVDSNTAVIGQAFLNSPATPIYYEDGSYINDRGFTGGQADNLLSYLDTREKGHVEDRVFGNITLDFTLADGLHFKTNTGINKRNRDIFTYLSIDAVNSDGQGTVQKQTYNHYTSEFLLTYDKEFGAHTINAIGGFTHEVDVVESITGTGIGFISDAYKYNNLGVAELETVTTNKTKWSLASLLSRVNYSYDGKYLLSASVRYDGSSKFGQENKWGFFPAASGAWVMSKENFLKDSNTISLLKLRASYGVNGNQGFGAYIGLGGYAVSNYPLGTDILNGLVPNSLDNPNLKWETTTSGNIGLDIAFDNGRYSFTIEAYKKETNDLIRSASLIETSGFSSANLNVGSMENSGMEFSTRLRLIQNKNFTWRFTGDIGFNNNRVIEYDGDTSQDWRIGLPLNASRGGYEMDGVFQTQEDLDNYRNDSGQVIGNGSLGDRKIIDQLTVDIDGDGIPDEGDGVINGDDIIVYLNPEPDFNYSFSNTLTYKNFDLDIMFYGVQGVEIFNQTRRQLFKLDNIRQNLHKDVFGNVWTESNPTGTLPIYGSTTYENDQSVWVEDGSFLRLQNISLGYNFNKLPGFFNSAKVYASAQNVFTITNYNGFNPDVGVNGVDSYDYPQATTITIGLNVKF